jgi:hypothetical protein
VLVSPTKRCGKTNVLIILLYLTPRSELASNISASALFRYVEEVRPTLLNRWAYAMKLLHSRTRAQTIAVFMVFRLLPV